MLFAADGMKCFRLCAISGKVPLFLLFRSFNLSYNFAEIPFQREAYIDGNVETETIGNTQVLLTNAHASPR